MSWSSRIGQWSGRFSPFGRSPQPGGAPQVSDADFSYITTEDLRRQAIEQASPSPPPPRTGSADTDVVIFQNKRATYPVHFPVYSIDRGELTVGDVRSAAAKKLSLAPTEKGRVGLLFKGRRLKDDERRAVDDGLYHNCIILCVVGEKPPLEEDDEDSGEDEEEGVDGVEDDGAERDPSKSKKKRNRPRKKKGKRPSGIPDSIPGNISDAHSGRSTPNPSQNKPLPAQPQTPMGKLEALYRNFHTTLVPLCVQFMSSPPSDKSKREFEYKKLSETILAQVLLKLDAVETEGDQEARLRRKEIVKEVQNVLNKLDAVMK